MAGIKSIKSLADRKIRQNAAAVLRTSAQSGDRSSAKRAWSEKQT